MITCRSWSQETINLTFEPWTHWPSRWCSGLSVDSSVNAKAFSQRFIVFSPQFSFRTVLLWTIFIVSLIFSLQSPEQKQTPVSPRASLPVEPQTRTAVSTPFLFFHLHIQWSYFPQSFHPSVTLPPSAALSLSMSLLMCYTIHLKTLPRCNVRTFIQDEGSSPVPGDTVPLCAPVERWIKCFVSCVCAHASF